MHTLSVWWLLHFLHQCPFKASLTCVFSMQNQRWKPSKSESCSIKAGLSHVECFLSFGDILFVNPVVPQVALTRPDTSLPSLGIGVASWSTSCPGAQAAQHMLRALRQPLPLLAFTSIFRLILAVGFLPPPIWFNICSQNRELLCL